MRSNQNNSPMKIRSLLMWLALGIAATSNLNANPNLLADPGFESGTPVSGGIGGWTTVVDAAFSQSYQHSGAYSLKTYYASTSSMGSSVQKVAAIAGTDYSLTGWALTPQKLSSSYSQGSLILFFADASDHLIGQFLGSALLTSNSPASTWIQLSVTGTAPANAAFVYAETLLWNPGPGDAIYFDDLSLTVVPEPSALAVLSASLGLGLLGRRRTPTGRFLGLWY
jgi:hypothetical protein